AHGKARRGRDRIVAEGEGGGDAGKIARLHDLHRVDRLTTYDRNRLRDILHIFDALTRGDDDRIVIAVGGTRRRRFIRGLRQGGRRCASAYHRENGQADGTRKRGFTHILSPASLPPSEAWPEI